MALRRRRKLTVEVSPTGGDNDGDRAADVEERAEPARVVVLDPAGEFGNAVDNDVSLDMYLVRPADIIRRAFDEFAFALRYFFLGAIVETQRDDKFIYFQTTEELVKQGGEVWGVPVLVKDRNLQRRIPAERFDPEDPDAVDNLCAVFNKCVHSTEAGYLILNVCKVDQWFIHREGTTTKLFGDNAGQLAREMFLLRNYFFHRTYLTAGENDLWAFAETLFSTMIALAEGFAPKLIPKKFRTAFHVHLGNVRKIRRVFFHLRDNYREPDSAGDCIAKLETIIGEVGSLGKDVAGWEHYLCGVLAPRFVIQGDFRDPFSAVEISEELPADPMDGFEVVGVPGSDITSMTHVARVDITDDGRLATRSFGVADPFSVTHADLINRALDWIGVFLRQLLSVGQEDCLNDNESAASDLYYLFANAPNQQRLARRHIPALYITTYVNPDSKSNRYWKMSVEEREAMKKARAARTRLESFCIDQDLDLDGIADDDTDDLERDFLSSTPYAVDPSSVLKFFERCFDKFGRLYNGADARFHRNVLNAIAEVDFPFQQTLRDIIKLRDSLSHHINIHSAGALRVRDLAHMVKATADLTRHLVEVFAPMNEGCMQYVNAFDELLSVFDLTVVRGEYSLYQTFRHRQGAYARAVHNESSDIEARGRLVTWGTRLARLFRDKAAGEGEVIPDADWEQILLVLRATTPSLQTDLGNDAEPPRSPNAVSIDLRWGGFGALEVDADVLQSVSTPPPLPDLKFPPRDDVCELVADEYEGDQLLRMLGDEPDDLMIVHYIKEKRHEGHLVKKEIRARLKTRNVSHTRFARLWIRAREEQGGSE